MYNEFDDIETLRRYAPLRLTQAGNSADPATSFERNSHFKKTLGGDYSPRQESLGPILVIDDIGFSRTSYSL